MESRVRRTPPPGLGELIRTARLRKGWRCREAERRLDMAAGYLARIEIGLRCPKPATAVHLADGLDMTEGERADLAAMMAAVWTDPDAEAA